MRAAPTSGSLELRENREDCAALGALGFVGLIPLTVWGGAIGVALADSSSSPPTSGGILHNDVVMMVLAVLFMLAMFAIPVIVPISILRRRQKTGARLDWNEEGVVEHDGSWKRNAIPWSRMEVAHLVWVIPGRSSRGTPQDVIQLFDRSSDVVISAWQGAPSGSPVVRRRVIAPDLPGFIEMLRKRKIPFSRKIDFARAEDPDRRRMKRWQLAIARLGYVGAVIGPMTAFPNPPVGMIVSVIAAALLAWRAVPAVRELRLVSARIRNGNAPAEHESEKNDPYREASPPPVSIDFAGRAEVDRTKRRAVIAEVACRVSFVILTLFAGAANALHPN